jgi:hypothetical protein
LRVHLPRRSGRRQDSDRACDEDEHGHHHEPAEEVLSARVERQVHAERHEHEQHVYLSYLAHEALQHLRVPLVLL